MRPDMERHGRARWRQQQSQANRDPQAAPASRGRSIWHIWPADAGRSRASRSKCCGCSTRWRTSTIERLETSTTVADAAAATSTRSRARPPASGRSAWRSWRGWPRPSCATGEPVNPERIDDLGCRGRGSLGVHRARGSRRGGIAAVAKALACGAEGAPLYAARMPKITFIEADGTDVRDRGRSRLDRDGNRDHERRAGDHRGVRRRLHLRHLPRLCRSSLDRDRRRRRR